MPSEAALQQANVEQQLTPPYRGAAQVPSLTKTALFDGIQAAKSANGTIPSFLHLINSSLVASDSLLSLARHDSEVHELVAAAARLGFFQYSGRAGEARLVHRDRIPTLWKPVLDGQVRLHRSGIYYTLDYRVPKNEVSRLLVVFSGVAGDPQSPYLARYFERNYRHIDSHVPGNTAVLRIADIGGVVGAFYMNTSDYRDRQNDVSDLIVDTAAQFGINSAAVCLVGSSKGGTGAALYGLSLNLPFVAVDPILEDEYYEEVLNDIHYTRTGPILARKRDIFESLAKASASRVVPSVFISSPNSPQCSPVSSFCHSIGSSKLLLSKDSRITDHPQVAGAVLGTTVTLVNILLSGWELPPNSQVL